MRSPLLLLTVSIVVATGCGNGDREATTMVEDVEVPGTSPSSGPWDESVIAGCELVTDQEIATALGRPVTEREEGGFYGCSWKTDSDLLVLRVFPDASLPADACSENQTSMPYGQSAKGRLQVVPDLGDAAIWGSSGDLLVCTRRGLLVVSFEYSAPAMAPSDQREAAVRIAATALGQLNQT